MANFQIIDRSGEARQIVSEPGQSLMAVLRDLDHVLASCGGHCLCGTCQVYLDPATFARVAPALPEEVEQLRLLPGFRADASRLACQLAAEVVDGAVVMLAPYE